MLSHPKSVLHLWLSVIKDKQKQKLHWACEQTQNPGREEKQGYLSNLSALCLFAQQINTACTTKSGSEASGILP